jgi:hypothetical protein
MQQLIQKELQLNHSNKHETIVSTTKTTQLKHAN